jgi:transcriptional regulator with XRE-family HTH domain
MGYNATVYKIADRLKKLRRDRGWSQYELARRTNGEVDRGYIGQLEARRITRPGYEKILALAKALDVSPAPLLEAAGYSGLLASVTDGRLERFLKKADGEALTEFVRLPYYYQRALLPVLRAMKRR